MLAPMLAKSVLCWPNSLLSWPTGWDSGLNEERLTGAASTWAEQDRRGRRWNPQARTPALRVQVLADKTRDADRGIEHLGGAEQKAHRREAGGTGALMNRVFMD